MDSNTNEQVLECLDIEEFISQYTYYEETNDDNLVERLEEFVKFLDETIDKEYENPASTANELIRKNSYCLALERDKNAIINILNGKRYYGYESEE